MVDQIRVVINSFNLYPVIFVHMVEIPSCFSLEKKSTYFICNSYFPYHNVCKSGLFVFFK